MISTRSGRALALAFLLGGCTSRWALRTEQAPFALQWPHGPARPKLTYLRSLTGLAAALSAGNTLAKIAYGADPGDTGAFMLPVAVATAPDGRIAVADMGRAVVHLFWPDSGRYNKLTGPKNEPMRTPVAVVFDGLNRLFVSDSSGGVYSFGPDGNPLGVLRKVGSVSLLRPTGIAYSPRSGLLFVADTLAHAIYALEPDGRLAGTFGGRGDGEGRFNFPTHIVWSAPGELFVTDSLNFRIQILDEKGKFLGAFGHHGDGSGDLAMAKGVAVDKDGIVYVADNLFDVVQLFNRRGELALTLGRRGTGFGEFWMPSGILIDAHGELYVCDTYNHRIQVFRISEGYEEPSR